MWTLFASFVAFCLLVDFFALNRQGAHKVSLREATIWSVIWVAVSFVFVGWLWWYLGGNSDDPFLRAAANDKALEYMTGYLVEKALAVDNVFVFLMIFTYFAVPAEFQKRVLMIGIVGALMLRAVMILIGAWAISRFHWILYLFGAFLVFTGVKMWWAAGQEPDLESNPALQWLRRRIRVAAHYDGEKLFTVQNGVRVATPLALVVLLIGIVDVIFAVDSIHDGSVHRAHLECVRNPRAARNVLPARWSARTISLAFIRLGPGPCPDRHQDAARGRIQGPGALVAAADGGDSRRRDGAVFDCAGKAWHA
jgi:tellurite resistance protein TerC